jgi:NADH:ubiquinone reductase (H+-translocating)
MGQEVKIFIIGGGFGGLHLARKLTRSRFSITLIDRQNHHQFQPLFYQVASSRLEPSTISFPFRKIFQRSQNVTFHLAEVLEVIPEKNTVKTTIGEYTYDYLVIATGCQTNYFGNTEIMKNALPMKTTMDAIEIRNRILMDFEQLMSAKGRDLDALLNIVIVGAGPTGVELAGAFAEMKSVVLPKDYPGFDFSKLKIILLEGSDNTLGNMSEQSSKASRKYLNQLGVNVRTGVLVTGYDGTTVHLSNGEKILCRNMIWAAGVTGNLIGGIGKNSITRSGRYIVDRYNRVLGFTNIFAIGDISYMETPLYPGGHPQVANVAINQGKNLAWNLKAILEGKNPENMNTGI